MAKLPLHQTAPSCGVADVHFGGMLSDEVFRTVPAKVPRPRACGKISGGGRVVSKDTLVHLGWASVFMKLGAGGGKTRGFLWPFANSFLKRNREKFGRRNSMFSSKRTRPAATNIGCIFGAWRGVERVSHTKNTKENIS